MTKRINVLGLLLLAPAIASGQDSDALSTHREFANAGDPCKERYLLPDPTGPRAVGAVTYHWADPERLEPGTSDPDDFRQFMATLFYPAIKPDAAQTRPYFPEIGTVEAAFRSTRRESPRNYADYTQIFACTETDTYADAEIDAGGSPYPLLLLSPGGDMSRHWYTAIAQDLTSHGYIVAVMSHAHSALDVFPLGGLVTKNAYYDEDDSTLNDMLSVRIVEDALFILDQLVAIGLGERNDRFAGHFDLDRLAILGHSRGNRAVRRGCAEDPRLRACIDFDSVGSELERQQELRSPQMTVRRAWEEERVRQLHAFLARNPIAAYDVVIENSGHFTYSDLAILVPERFGAEIDPVVGHELWSAVTRALLGKYLLGRPAEILDDPAAALPGVVVQRFGPGAQ